MQFNQTLQPAILIKRYKRFLADVTLENGKEITVHCPNSGSMLGCDRPGSAVMVSRSDNPKRKYPHTLEMIRVDGCWVGIHTGRSNHLVREALENGAISQFGTISSIRPEVKTGNSRLDFLLENGEGKIYLEVKNCTLAENRLAMFPDAVTVRGAKHLNELLRLRQEGHRAVIIYCIQRTDADIFSPAAHIDPIYARTLDTVCNKGVEALAFQAEVKPEAIAIYRQVPVRLGCVEQGSV